jgi:hypothetical protein
VGWGDLGDAIAHAGPGWLAAAVLLHVAGQAARGLGWHAILSSSVCTRERRLGRARTAACHVAGAGAGGLVSARGGDVVRVLLVRRRLKGVSCCTLAGTLVVDAAFETVFGLLLVLWAVSVGLEAAQPGPGLLLALVALTAVAVVGARSERVARALRDVRRGLAVLGRPRVYLTRVLPWQVAGRVSRLAAVGCFLAAFGLPVSAAAIGCLVAAHGGGRLVPVPGASAAAGAALLTASFAPVTGYVAEPAALAAVALTLAGLLTLVGVVISTGLLVWLLEVRSPRRVLPALRAGLAQAR